MKGSKFVSERRVDKRFSVWCKLFENASLDFKVTSPQLAASSPVKFTGSNQHKVYLKIPPASPCLFGCQRYKAQRLLKA